MNEIEILPFYEHQHSPSVFVMFNKNYEVIWSYSGNNLASIYEEKPRNYISGPLELPIPESLDRILTDYYDNPLVNRILARFERRARDR